MSVKIFKPVGAGAPNRPRCVSTIYDLLNRVPVHSGGPPQPLPAGDMPRLQEAIFRFQAHHKVTQANGVIDPNSRSLVLLTQHANPIPRTVVLAVNGGYFQTDPRWDKINMNTSSGIEYTIGYKGCAISSVASAFASKNVRIINSAAVQQKIQDKQRLANKRHKHRLRLGIDYGAITPLTLDAWMTLKGGQGYKTSHSVSIDWEGVANISPDITFVYETKQWDKRYPSPAQLRALLDQGFLIIAFHPTRHFVLLTGYEGEITFKVWDVGYSSRHSYTYDQLASFTLYKHQLSHRTKLRPAAY